VSDPTPEDLRVEVERLRADNRQLRAEVDRLRAELFRLGRYLGAPAAIGSGASEGESEIAWAYRRGDLEDDLGDD
jgi:hypothetical protein